MNREEVYRTLCYPIHRNWKSILIDSADELEYAVEEVYLKQKYNIEKITPNIKNTFNAFIINPSNVKIIIIGQDPYPTAGDANGFSFSTNAKDTPASLKNIFTCLNRLGYKTNSPNLFNWVFQGIMLLNLSLTTMINSKKVHTDYWKNFIYKIISILTNKYTGIKFLLWGNDAQSIKPHINRRVKHKVYEWTHPSPMADCRLEDNLKFVNCSNFDNLKQYDWSTGQHLEIYTDGGCILHKISSFAIYIEDKLDIYGLVKDNLYKLSDKDEIEILSNTQIDNTSQRGEYLAMSYALWIVVYYNLVNVKIITDSANVYGILCEWKKRKQEEYKNSDLVVIMRSLYKQLGNKVKIIHVNSHSKTDPEYKKGNHYVDSLATKALEEKPTNIVKKFYNAELRLPI